MVEKLTWLDYFLGFIYAIVISFLIYFYAKKKKKTDVRYRYYFSAFVIKLFAAFGFILFFRYYYYGGDTFVYFMISKEVVSLLFEDPARFWEFFTSSLKNFDFIMHPLGRKYAWFISSTDGFAMAKIMFFFNLLGCNTYIATTFVVSVFSFLGLWKIYMVMTELYQGIEKPLMIGILLIPSVLFWGSAILKDTIVIGALGFVFYGLYRIFIVGREYSYVGIVLFSLYLIFLTKPYVLYIFVPLVTMWIVNLKRNSIRSRIIRIIITPLYYMVAIAISGIIIYQVTREGGKYSLSSIEKTMEGFYTWHTYLAQTQNQSGYTLGDFDMSPTGILKKIPLAINVSLFRPYPWEVRSLTMLMGSIESLLFFLMTVFTILQVGLVKTLQTIWRDETLKFFFLYSLLFAAMAGLTSYNFGALSRYKIPMMPFYATMMIVIYYKALYLYKKRLEIIADKRKKIMMKHIHSLTANDGKNAADL